MTNKEKESRGREKRQKMLEKHGRKKLKYGSDLPKDVFVENLLDEELNAQYNFENHGCLFRNGKELTLVKLISLK